MPFEAHYRSPEGNLRHHLGEEEAKAAFESREGLLWVDVTETTSEDGEFLRRAFNFHHLAIESCVDPKVFPAKVDDFHDYLFIIAHGVNHVVEADIVTTAELSLFIGHHFVVSNHNYPLGSVESIKRLVEDDGRPMRKGAAFLAYALIDALVDNVAPTIDQMGYKAEEIEEAVVHSLGPWILESIMQLKRSTQRLHRVMSPQREVLNRLSRGEFPIIPPEAQIYYRDIYDHMVRIEDWNQILSDRADNALAIYLSSVSNRQNEAMKRLSTVATTFMPLTLIAAIYGMNFENMPELKVSWAYYAVLGFMGLVAAIAIWLAWARTWLAQRHRLVARIRLLKAGSLNITGHRSSGSPHQ